MSARPHPHHTHDSQPQPPSNAHTNSVASAARMTTRTNEIMLLLALPNLDGQPAHGTRAKRMHKCRRSERAKRQLIKRKPSSGAEQAKVRRGMHSLRVSPHFGQSLQHNRPPRRLQCTPVLTLHGDPSTTYPSTPSTACCRLENRPKTDQATASS